MEVRERHTPSRITLTESDVLPGAMTNDDAPKSGIYSTRTSAVPMARTVPVTPRVDSDSGPKSGLWEGEMESEEVVDGGYGSKETLSKEEMMQQDPWTFPVRPVFPSRWKKMFGALGVTRCGHWTVLSDHANRCAHCHSIIRCLHLLVLNIIVTSTTKIFLKCV